MGGKNIAAGSNLLAASRPPTIMETSTFKNIVRLQQTVIAINIEHHIATWTDPLRKRAPRRKAIPSAGVTLKDDAEWESWMNLNIIRKKNGRKK
jgi:hypothetical protein